jgi:hypothetical protein
LHLERNNPDCIVFAITLPSVDRESRAHVQTMRELYLGSRSSY